MDDKRDHAGERNTASPMRAGSDADGVGTVIKRARAARNWRQDDLAKRSGYSQATISRVEQGDTRAGTDMDLLADLADALDIPRSSLGLIDRDAETTPPALPSPDGGTDPRAEYETQHRPALARLRAALRRHRRDNDLSLHDLGVLSSYSLQYVTAVERPGTNLPSANLIDTLDDALHANGELKQLHDDAARELRRIRQRGSHKTRNAVDDENHVVSTNIDSSDRVMRTTGLEDHRPSNPLIDRQPALQGAIAGTLCSLTNALDSRWEPGIGAVAQLDPHYVRSYADITTSYCNMYWFTNCYTLVAPVATHVDMGARALENGGRPTADALALAATLAQSALLLGRLLFFDVRAPRQAQRAFSLGQQAAAFARRHDLAAAVFAHQAFIPGFDGRVSDFQSLMEQAWRHAAHCDGPLLTAWLHCVDGELYARAGNTKEALERVESAKSAALADGTDPQWFDFFDQPRLLGFSGQILARTSRQQDATACLTQAISNLGDNAAKQQAMLLADLATVQASTDPEWASVTAHQALDLLELNPYSTAIAALQQFSPKLGGGPNRKELDDRLRALLPALETHF